MVFGEKTLRALLQSEKVRFGIVGGINTVTDFSVLFILAKIFGVPVFAANIVSTSAGIAVSYLLNKKAVFGGRGRTTKRQIILFVTVTLTGLWIIQTIIIEGISQLCNAVLHVDEHGVLVLFFAKAVATLVTLIWNYMWYSRVVFKKGQS